MKIDLTTPWGRHAVNEALARLTELPNCPDFLAGLRPNGTCDESQVNGDLLWKVMRRLAEGDKAVSLTRFEDKHTKRPDTMHGSWLADTRELRGCGQHDHPIVALAIAARGLLEEKPK